MKKPHWTKKVPTAPGLYWCRHDGFRPYPPYPAWNAGKEFTFIGTDAAASPKELRAEGMKFWSEKLEVPK
jgi:hypothetical protein